MSKVKTGDYVINYYMDEGLLHVGRVSEVHDENEHDIEFISGGCVSPVNTEDSIIIPEELAYLLDRIIDSVPTDENGEFILKEITHD